MFVKIAVQSDDTQSPRWYKTDEEFEVIYDDGKFYRMADWSMSIADKSISVSDCAVLVTCVESFKYGIQHISIGDEYWAYQDKRGRKYVLLQRDGEKRVEISPEVMRMQFKTVQ